MNNNLIRCPTCNALLISEEIYQHNCQLSEKIIDIDYKWYVKTTLEKFGGDVLIIQGKDGTLYRIKPYSPKNQHPFTTPEDETEPNFSLIFFHF